MAAAGRGSFRMFKLIATCFVMIAVLVCVILLLYALTIGVPYNKEEKIKHGDPISALDRSGVLHTGVAIIHKEGGAMPTDDDLNAMAS